MKSIQSFPLLRGVFGQSGAADAPYECAGCGARLSVRFQQCPECGGYSIDRADWIAGE